MNTFPGYVFQHRTYKTVSGLGRALFKAHPGATQHSMVVNNRITLYGSDRVTVIAVYRVSPPVFGEKQLLTKES